ncbi:dCTP deaminase/dUTPase family protein, partial [Staphylococcus pseudoxylosus]
KTHLVVETGKIDAGFQGHMKINVKNDEESTGFETNFIKGIDEGWHQLEQEIPSGTYIIQKGERLAQLVIIPIFTPELVPVKEFSNETARGQNGFGSSGTR